MDEVIVEGNYAFARKDKTFVALIGANCFEYLPFHKEKAAVTDGLLRDPSKRFELVQRGRKQHTIYELSTAEKESFEQFMDRIKANEVAFDGRHLTYRTEGKEYALTYEGDFTVNGEVQPYEYKRYDSSYVQADYLSEDLVINSAGGTHRVNVAKNVRE